MTTIAVLLLAVWVILQSQGPVSSTLSLIIGLVAGLLALLDLTGYPAWTGRLRR